MSEREPIHEPAVPLIDEESAWVHEAAGGPSRGIIP
jgi:hypothetical protein